MKAGKKYLAPVIFLVIFEAVAVTLWLTKDMCVWHDRI